jgi:uncharacterized protein
VRDKAGLVDLPRGHEVVVSSVHFTAGDPRLLIDAIKAAGAKRYFVVEGASSLEVKAGTRLIDTLDFPEAGQSGRGGAFLDLLRREPDIILPVPVGSIRARRAIR